MHALHCATSLLRRPLLLGGGTLSQRLQVQISVTTNARQVAPLLILKSPYSLKGLVGLPALPPKEARQIFMLAAEKVLNELKDGIPETAGYRC